jgi:carboxypeptidase T
MFGFDLVEGYGSDARITAVMDAVRTVLVPVQNPDGFVRSRESATGMLSALAPANMPVGNVQEFEYHRKNMRRHTNQPEETGLGVDTNRNYGFNWGGAGSSGTRTSQTYRGASPFSEPESESVRQLLNTLQAVTLNTNHTYGRLILRPPGYKGFPDTPDEIILKTLGDAMGDLTGYESKQSWGLYDTTGTTVDWAYGAHGTLSYTFEHGGSFHPNYASYIPAAYVDGKLRDCFLMLAEAAADPATHGVLAGRVTDGAGSPVAAEIRITKAWDAPLWENGDGSNPTGEDTYPEWVDSQMETADGDFAFHVNPSRRPYDLDDEPYRMVVTTADGRGATRDVRVTRGETVPLGDIIVS